MTEIKEREAGVSPEQQVANLRAWIQDLRATGHLQGTGQCRSIDGLFCALGRGAAVIGAEFIVPKRVNALVDYEVVYEGETAGNFGFIPTPAIVALGITRGEESSVQQLNDDRHSFSEIADWLEVNILPRVEAKASRPAFND